MKEIYDKMMKENLTFKQAALLLEPKRSYTWLRNRMIDYCYQNSLPMPKQKPGPTAQKVELKKEDNVPNH